MTTKHDGIRLAIAVVILAVGLLAAGSGLLVSLKHSRAADARSSAATALVRRQAETISTNRARIEQLESYVAAKGLEVPPAPETVPKPDDFNSGTTTTTSKPKVTTTTTRPKATTTTTARSATTERPTTTTTSPAPTTTTTTKPCLPVPLVPCLLTQKRHPG